MDIVAHVIFILFTVLGIGCGCIMLIPEKGKTTTDVAFNIIVSLVPFALGVNAFLWYGVYLGWWM